MRLCFAALAAAGISTAVPSHRTALHEDFSEGEAARARLVLSSAPRYAGQRVAVAPPDAFVDNATEALGLTLASEAAAYAVTLPFPGGGFQVAPQEALVLHYDVRFQRGVSCAGGYVKLLEAGTDASALASSSPYVLMFGPDSCGDTHKVHLILQWRDPTTGVVTERALAEAPAPKTDAATHSYTLVLRPDGSFSIKIDGKPEAEGRLDDPAAFTPPLQPPLHIADPADAKPADWVDEADMPDPTAVKPADWDDAAPATIPDPTATRPPGWLTDTPPHVPDPAASRPAAWDDEEDGEWAAPLVANPACEAAPGCGEWAPPRVRNPAARGVWAPPRVRNPAYKGSWEPRMIPNPGYYALSSHPHTLQDRVLAALAIEVWTMDAGLHFDNIYVGTDEDAAAAAVEAHTLPRRDRERAGLREQERARARAQRAAAAAEGGLLATAAYYFGELADLAAARPGAAVAALVASTLAVVAICFVHCLRSLDGVDPGEVEAETARLLAARAAAAAPSASAEDAATEEHATDGALDDAGAVEGAADAAAEDDVPAASAAPTVRRRRARSHAH